MVDIFKVFVNKIPNFCVSTSELLHSVIIECFHLKNSLFYLFYLGYRFYSNNFHFFLSLSILFNLALDHSLTIYNLGISFSNTNSCAHVTN